ncbi:hypothetical protein ABID22_002850 [Pontibacter aydingkolensis]
MSPSVVIVVISGFRMRLTHHIKVKSKKAAGTHQHLQLFKNTL